MNAFIEGFLDPFRLLRDFYRAVKDVIIGFVSEARK